MTILTDSPQGPSPLVMDPCGLGVSDLSGVKGETVFLAGTHQQGETGTHQGSKKLSGEMPAEDGSRGDEGELPAGPVVKPPHFQCKG